MQRGIGFGIVKSTVTVFILSCALVSRAADVGVGLYQLSPDPVTIKAGEIVYWYDLDPDFAPYFISGAWGTIATPDFVIFNSTGTYPYIAQSLYGGLWDGTVYVIANSPPTVTITNPLDKAVFAAPATFPFEADAYDPDPNDVLDVEFWVNDTMVDDDYFAPYGTIVTNLAAGTYILTAIVWDFSFVTATNSITITVGSAAPIKLTDPALSGGKFTFNANGLVVGKTNVLQSSTNLALPSGWVPVLTNVAESTKASFTNTVTAGARFFRLIQLP